MGSGSARASPSQAARAHRRRASRTHRCECHDLCARSRPTRSTDKIKKRIRAICVICGCDRSADRCPIRSQSFSNAKGGSRTPIAFRLPDPKSGASASSATFAWGLRRVGCPSIGVQVIRPAIRLSADYADSADSTMMAEAFPQGNTQMGRSASTRLDHYILRPAHLWTLPFGVFMSQILASALTSTMASFAGSNQPNGEPQLSRHPAASASIPDPASPAPAVWPRWTPRHERSVRPASSTGVRRVCVVVEDPRLAVRLSELPGARVAPRRLTR